MYDFIGDIHGHASKLHELLLKLGYRRSGSTYYGDGRKAVFVGDLIDRGPDSREVLRIVRSMSEAEQALAVMGNHEYNALCLSCLLRPRTLKNIRQQYSTLKGFRNEMLEWHDHLRWIYDLPLFLELPEGPRVVHAFWNQEKIDFMRSQYGTAIMNEDFIHASRRRGREEYEVIGNCLIGQEVELPEGMYFQDSDGRRRSDMRVKWWMQPHGKTYREIGLSGAFPDIPLPSELADSIMVYGENEAPVFFGHYWLKGEPHVQSNNVCCLDFSVARKGVLSAYRWDGEKVLSNDKLIYV